MAWRKKPPPAAGSAEAPAGGTEQLEEFCRGLYPILVEGDLAAFRRYLAQWEEVIGDTAELADTPPDQQRRTMAALLRRPQQFNLPPWPVANAAPTRPSTAGVSPTSPRSSDLTPALRPGAGPLRRPQAGSRHSPAPLHSDGEGTRPEQRGLSMGTAPLHQTLSGDSDGAQAVRRGHEFREQKSPSPRRGEGAGGEVPSAGTYQLDMLTGEFVPVEPEAVAEPGPAPYVAEGDEPKP
ncbi:MAG: hypothetical protein ACRDI2_05015, partial [Chloroflexota bacterium]